MKTKAVRIYGKNDLRLEEFELPPLQEDEILAHIVSDSICMSSYKMAIQGEEHKRVPDNLSQNPVIVGHEFAGELVEVGAKWRKDFARGDKFSIQPALNYQGSLAAPGYSFPYIGGDATYVIIPNVVMEQGCLLPFRGEAFFHASLSEPASCIIGAFHASYHTESGKYVHQMGIKPGGNLAILAGAGPMGLGAIDYAIHCDRRPKLLVVTDIDDTRIGRAEAIFTPQEAEQYGVTLRYVNTASLANPAEYLRSLTGKGGYDDVFVFAPVKPVVEQGDRILGRDGCLNFFAGPTDPDFSALLNFYNVHYASTHLVGTSGGNTEDMKEALLMMEQGKLNPAVMVTHIGGLDAVVETTLNLPHIPGGKKLIYTGCEMPLAPITEFSEKGKSDPLFRELASITRRHNGLWSAEAERFLLNSFTKV
ncbi:MAG TPA: zinc-binding dehydrogenase [Atribacteraceae bacterium]|nr:zinc-binding dehydrogenase [Atribacteraceae bacterium]